MYISVLYHTKDFFVQNEIRVTSSVPVACVGKDASSSSAEWKEVHPDKNYFRRLSACVPGCIVDDDCADDTEESTACNERTCGADFKCRQRTCLDTVPNGRLRMPESEDQTRNRAELICNKGHVVLVRNVDLFCVHKFVRGLL